MSSNIPVRRTIRMTRATSTAKDAENTNARPSRLSRAKSLAASATALLEPVTARVAAPAVAVKVKATGSKTEAAAVKRKRDILVEVTSLVANNKGKAKMDAMINGKEKEEPVDQAVPSKKQVVTKAEREPLRAVSGPITRRMSKSSGVVVKARPALAVVKERPVPVPSIHDIPATHQSTVEPTSKRRAFQAIDDAEVERVFKKRHTTPEVQDESQLDADLIAAELADVGPELSAELKLWDDLDAEDWDDPAMISEYVVDVCQYLKEVEITTQPDAHYLDSHSEVDWEKRGILMDWIIQVHARFHLLPESLFLCTNILDRFLSTRPVSLSKLQLVGVTCFFIASKFEETMAPAVAEIAYLADGQYTVQDILKAERYVLKTIDWDLRYPGPMGWLRRGSKADDCEEKARTVAKYLMEISICEWRLVGILPSLLAAAALWLARLVLGREEWTHNLAHYTTYSESELLSTANILINYILQPIQHESLYKKYAHRHYLRCSKYMRSWALERWPEGSVVDLVEDLGWMKADARRERELAQVQEAAQAASVVPL